MRPVAGPTSALLFYTWNTAHRAVATEAIHSKLRTQNAACPSIFPYVCCSINFRICGVGVVREWRQRFVSKETKLKVSQFCLLDIGGLRCLRENRDVVVTRWRFRRVL